MEDRPDQEAPSSLLTAIHAQLAPVVSSDAARVPTETLLADLKAADWCKRLAALHLLVERKSSVPPDDLQALLADDDSSVRAAAVYLLGHLHEQASVELVVAALDDPSWLVRENALLALGELGAAGVPVPIEQFEKRLADAQEFVRESAALALRKARHEEVAKEKPTFLRSFASLIRQLRPVDISGEAEIGENGLGEQEETEPVITDLVPVRPLHPLLRPSRLSRAQRWFTVASAAVVVFGLFAAWLLVLPRLWGTQPAQSTPRVLFQATNLGSLYMPAWATAPRFSISIVPCVVDVPAATLNVPPAQCTPEPVTQTPTPAGGQYLSFVDGGGHLYTWRQNDVRPVRSVTLKSGDFSGDSPLAWQWLYPGRYMVSYEHTSGAQNTERIWDAIQGKLLFTTSDSLPFAMTQDGWLAALTPKHTVRIWNTYFPDQGGSGQQVVSMLSSLHFSQLFSLNWSPDDSQLATVSVDGTIEIWNPFAGKGSGLLLQTLHLARDNAGVGVQWSPDGQRLATVTYNRTSGPLIQIWDLLDGHLLQNFNGFTGFSFQSINVAWLNDGRAILSSGLNEIMVQDAISGKILLDMPKSNVPFLSFSPAQYLSPDQHWLALPQSYGIQIVDLHSDKVLHTLPNNKNKDYFINIALSPDNMHLATVDENGLAQVWNMQTGRVAWTYQLPANFSGAVARFVLNVNNGQAITWSNPVGAAWSPDDKMLAVTYQGGGLVILGMPGQ